jgi:hypothetical protein
MTRFELPYGGDDITKALAWMLSRTGRDWPYPQCDVERRPNDRLIVTRIKETLCHLPPLEQPEVTLLRSLRQSFFRCISDCISPITNMCVYENDCDLQEFAREFFEFVIPSPNAGKTLR